MPAADPMKTLRDRQLEHQATPVRVYGSNLRHAEAVTPDDDNDLTGVVTYGAACAVYVGVSGDVVVKVGETDVTFADLAAGMWHPMPPFTRVKEASDATGIVAGY